MTEKLIWNEASGSWLQDEAKKRFFILNKEETPKNNQEGLEIIAGAKWHPNSDSDCGGFFPLEFKNCPFCGKALKSIKDKDCGNIWVPPFGKGNGLRLVDKDIDIRSIPPQRDKRWIDQDENDLPLPRPRGDYEFIVGSLGTEHSVLIALDRMTGLLNYFSPAQNKWIQLLSTKDDCKIYDQDILPHWSWSAAFITKKLSHGFAVPTCNGPVWVDVDWDEAKYTPFSGSGECIAGAAALKDQVFIPVRLGDKIAILSFDPTVVHPQWKQVGDLIEFGITSDSKEDQCLSVPIVHNEKSTIYWIGKPGLITFDWSKKRCSWRPWETDAFPCQAMPEFGPPYCDKLSNFWQLCYDTEYEDVPMKNFRYYKLSGDESDRTDVDGGRFSSGLSSFSRSYELWHEPWSRVDSRQEKVRKIRVPLLCLHETSKATITVRFGSGDILPLLNIIKDRKKAYEVTLQIEFPDHLPVELRMKNHINISAPWELHLFIYQDYLYAYSSNEGVCHRWKLK